MTGLSRIAALPNFGRGVCKGFGHLHPSHAQKANSTAVRFRSILNHRFHPRFFGSLSLFRGTLLFAITTGPVRLSRCMHLSDRL